MRTPRWTRTYACFPRPGPDGPADDARLLQAASACTSGTAAAKPSRALPTAARSRPSRRARPRRSPTSCCCSLLSTTRAVEEVAFGADGIAGAEGRRKVLVDPLLDLSPDATAHVFARPAREPQRRAAWVDAPVSGRRGRGREDGTLAIMAGSPPRRSSGARPALTHLAPSTSRTWASAGTGQADQALRSGRSRRHDSRSIAEAVTARPRRQRRCAGAGRGAFAGGFADSLPLQIFLRMVSGWRTDRRGRPAAQGPRHRRRPRPARAGRRRWQSLARELIPSLAAQGRSKEDPARSSRCTASRSSAEPHPSSVGRHDAPSSITVDLQVLREKVRLTKGFCN